MSDEWAKGDLALAVGPFFGSLAAIMPAGSPHTVSDKRLFGDQVGLQFDDVSLPDEIMASGLTHWNARFFRRIAPHEPDAEDAVVISMMRGEPASVPIRIISGPSTKLTWDGSRWIKP